MPPDFGRLRLRLLFSMGLLDEEAAAHLGGGLWVAPPAAVPARLVLRAIACRVYNTLLIAQ
jgi:hypothetical protein